MKKKLIILFVLIAIILIILVLLFINSNNGNNIKKVNEKLTLENESIKIVNGEVFIEATLKNSSKEKISLKNVDLILTDSSNKEVLRVTSQINQILNPSENIMVSSQTKANLDSNQKYKLETEY